MSTLNELIQTCKDGENGFRAAAESVEDSNLRHLLESYAQQRAEFAADLPLGGAAARGRPGGYRAPSSAPGPDTKAGLTKRDEATVIAECEQGEDAAVRAYQKSLESHMPSDLRMTVERQLVEVKKAHDHILSLERSHARIG